MVAATKMTARRTCRSLKWWEKVSSLTGAAIPRGWGECPLLSVSLLSLGLGLKGVVAWQRRENQTPAFWIKNLLILHFQETAGKWGCARERVQRRELRKVHLNIFQETSGPTSSCALDLNHVWDTEKQSMDYTTPRSQTVIWVTNLKDESE